MGSKWSSPPKASNRMGPLDGCAFHIQAFGDPLMNFILEIARAGDMVIVPAMDGNLLILVSEAQISEVPADLRHDSQAVVAEARPPSWVRYSAADSRLGRLTANTFFGSPHRRDGITSARPVAHTGARRVSRFRQFLAVCAPRFRVLC